jgi:hypothetical protein
MRIMTKFKLVLFSLSLGMAAVSVAGTPLFPGMLLLEEGVIDYVDPETDELGLNDTTYQLYDNTLVRTSSGASSSLGRLQAGRAVRIYGDPAVLEGGGGPIYAKGIELR